MPTHGTLFKKAFLIYRKQAMSKIRPAFWLREIYLSLQLRDSVRFSLNFPGLRFVFNCFYAVQYSKSA